MARMIKKTRYDRATDYAIKRQFISQTKSGRDFWRRIYQGISAKYYHLLAGETI